MKHYKSEREQYLHKRSVRFVRRAQASVLAGTVLMAGGFAAHAATVADVIDTQYYADRYPDLKAAFGYDSQALVQHYLTYGIYEERDAGGLLDVREYREKYADLNEAFGDNWDAYVDHFLTYGVYERRDSGTAFNALDYAERYGDLKEAFGDNVLQLFQHYQTYGKNESRESRSETVVQEEKRAEAARQEAARQEAARQEAARQEAAQEAWENRYPVLTDAEGNVPDLGGMEIIIRDWFSGDGERAEAADEATELLYDYQDWAMEKYNFKIVQKTISGWGDCLTDFMDYVVSGGDENNYVFTLRNSGEFEQYKKAGYMYDLSKLDCLNFSEDKWRSGVHLYHTDPKTGAIYAMRPFYPEPRTGLYFNKRVLQESGINLDDIYKWQEDGSWTWDKFEELCKQITQDLDGDGVPDIWALNGFVQRFFRAAVASNGAEYVGMENGKYVNKVESDETMEAMTWAMDMWEKYCYPQPEGAEWNYFEEAWRSGIGAFYAGEPYEAGLNFNPDVMADDFGFVCFPKGPNATDYTNWYIDNPYVIPACYDDQRAWNIAFALNVWTQPIEGYEDYRRYLDACYSNFRDTESVDLTLTRLVKNGTVTFHSLIDHIDDGEIYWSVNENNSLAQQLESIRVKWNYYIALANGEDVEMPEELMEDEY